MTQATPATTPAAEGGGLVRVTVLAGRRRGDVALPGQVPVAELLPELARSLTMLDPETVYAGYSLVTADGRALDGRIGLWAQGVDAGSVLALEAGVDRPTPKVYDDVVEAMADTVESDLRAWDPAVGRRTALTAAALVLALGALALGLLRPDVIAGAAAGTAALVLLATAVVLDRTRSEHETALLVAWSGVLFAATGGLTASPGAELVGLPSAIGAAAALTAALVAIAGLQTGRIALIPAAVVSAVLAVTGTIVAVTDLDAASVHTVALVIVVLAGSLLPWLSLLPTSTKAPELDGSAELTGAAEPVDADDVRRDARLGHGVLVAITCSVALLAVLTAPLAVQRGVTGALVAVAAGVVLLLRTRQYRVGTEVIAGLAGGVAVLASTCVAIVAVQRAWLPTVSVVLAVVAVLLLVSTLVPRPTSVRWGRLGDVAEVVALVAMLPLLVFAIGLVGSMSP